MRIFWHKWSDFVPMKGDRAKCWVATFKEVIFQMVYSSKSATFVAGTTYQHLSTCRFFRISQYITQNFKNFQNIQNEIYVLLARNFWRVEHFRLRLSPRQEFRVRTSWFTFFQNSKFSKLFGSILAQAKNYTWKHANWRFQQQMLPIRCWTQIHTHFCQDR